MRHRALDVAARVLSAAFVAWTSTAALAVEVARVVDIDSGPAGSGAGWLTVYEDRLYFTANDLTHGNNVELWRYDGVEVSRAAEIRPGPEGSTPSDLAVHDGTLFFAARGDDGSPRLWRFDGETAALAPGSASGAQNPGELTSFGGALWFRAFRSGFGVELWRHDGATQTIFDLYPGSGSSYPQHFIEHDGALWFSGNVSPGDGSELCRFDGRRVTEVVNLRADGGSSPAWPVVFRGALYFSANDGLHGNELWRYDGHEGTLAADIVAGGPYDSGNPAGMTVYGDALYFSADNGIDGFELWRYDDAGAVMIADINPTPPEPFIDPVHHSFPAELFVHEGLLYMSADDGRHGPELWTFDGRTARLAADIYPGPYGSRVAGFADWRGVLHFAADDGTTGSELTEARPGVFRLVGARELLFLRGDANDDGAVDVSDPVRVLLRLFAGAPPLACAAAANVNDDEAVDISDPTALLAHLFLGGPPPPAPYPECGPPASYADESLGCEEAVACE